MIYLTLHFVQLDTDFVPWNSSEYILEIGKFQEIIDHIQKLYKALNYS